MEEIDRREKEEARRSYHEREAEKNQRIADNSLDPDNKKAYAHLAEQHRKKAAQIAEKPVANSGESGIIEIQNNQFHSQDDPMYEVTGSAYDSNPVEIQEILAQLEEWGVTVNHGAKTLGYGCIRNGKPGTMSITKDASYSAWLHEFQHARDDMEAGWNGHYVLWCDPEERIRREKRAYGVEISLAKALNREDIVSRLEANLNAEIERIWKNYYKYSDYL